MTIERFQQGDPRPGAGRLNEVVDQLNRNGRPGASGEARYGAAGVTFHGPPRTLLGLFELGQAMVYPDASESDPDEPTPYSEQAKAVWFSHAEGRYGGTANSKDETLYHPTAFRNDDGVAIGHPPCAPGQRCFAWYNRQSGRWEMLTPPLDLWRFELKDDLEPGSQATAYLLPFDDSYGEDTDVEFEVYDPLGIHRGRRIGKYASPHNRGSQGYAKYLPDSGRWEVLGMQPHALMIRGQATAGFNIDDGTFTIDGVAVVQPTGGVMVDQDPAGNVTVYNIFGWNGDDNVNVMAVWNESTDHWEALQVGCEP